MRDSMQKVRQCFAKVGANGNNRRGHRFDGRGVLCCYFFLLALRVGCLELFFLAVFDLAETCAAVFFFAAFLPALFLPALFLAPLFLAPVVLAFLPTLG